MTFADKLKDLRQRAGLSQAQLAEGSGVPVWTLRNYEQGRREPNWKAVIHLAKALGVAVEVFDGCVSKDDTADDEPNADSASKPPATSKKPPAAAKPKPRPRKGTS